MFHEFHLVRKLGPRSVLAAILLLAASSCADQSLLTQRHSALEPPNQLSAWNLFRVSDQGLRLAQDGTHYALNTPLFSDYAQKIRTIHVPDGQQLVYNNSGAFDAPVGTIISKTFLYPKNNAMPHTVSMDTTQMAALKDVSHNSHTLLETRLLVKDVSGWIALPYKWDGEDAYLAITGDLLEVPVDDGSVLDYLIPSKNQCASCHATNHTTAALEPIGIKARHLNRHAPHSDINQLAQWVSQQQLADLPELSTVPANYPLESKGAPDSAQLDHAARSYLDINCGHCHNAQGAADTSGLLLDYQAHSKRDLGMCKPPIAAGRGSGGYFYSIVPGKGAESIMTFRLRTTDPGSMMPELGRSVAHQQGVELIEAWIDSFEGECL